LGKKRRTPKELRGKLGKLSPPRQNYVKKKVCQVNHKLEDGGQAGMRKSR